MRSSCSESLRFRSLIAVCSSRRRRTSRVGVRPDPGNGAQPGHHAERQHAPRRPPAGGGEVGHLSGEGPDPGEVRRFGRTTAACPKRSNRESGGEGARLRDLRRARYALAVAQPSESRSRLCPLSLLLLLHLRQRRLSTPRSLTKLLQSPARLAGIVEGRHVIERAAVRTEVSEGPQLDYRHGDDRLPRRRRCGLLLHRPRRDPHRPHPLRRRRHARHRHGLPPPADAPQLQDLQVGRVRPDLVRDAGARRRPDLLGGDASHPSSALRSRGRSAHAA